MDKIEKFLQKLTQAERKLLASIMTKVRDNNLRGFDVKPLKGYKNLYRLRRSNFRVIFWCDSKSTTIVHVDYRKDSYKKL